MVSKQKLTVGVLFGGRSVEHEISVITALQLMDAMDSRRYNIVPIYIAPSGKWYTGERLRDRDQYRKIQSNKAGLREVTLLPDPSVGGLTVLDRAGIEILGELVDHKSGVIPIDVYFLSFHGEFGEDGAIQGLMELAGVAYTGCGVAASALSMNKFLCKAALKAHDIPVLPDVVVSKKEALGDFAATCDSIMECEGFEKFPLFVKPCNLGSSIGITKAIDAGSLASGLAKVFRHDEFAIVEPCIENLMEINVSVLDGDPVEASAVEIPVSSSGVLSYEDKYLREKGAKKTGESSGGMASLTRKINPSELDSSIRDEVISLACQAFSVLSCSGVVRFDFMYDLDKGELYFNELNAQPGSFSFYLWVESEPQVLYTELIDRVIERALTVREMKASLVKEVGFRALAE